jgi:AbiU2
MSKESLLKLAASVRGDVQRAIALYEVFLPTGKDADLIQRVNAVSVEAASAYNVVSEALHRQLIATLCRVWDTHKSAAHLPKLAAALKKQRKLVQDGAALDEWLSEVDRLQDWEPLVTLLGFRNVGEAHTADPNLPDPRSLKRPRGRRVAFGDERKVLEATVKVMRKLDRLLGVEVDPHEDKALSAEAWKRRSAELWGALRG